ncbi:MAG TPA: S-layer homology domain-containing protein [Stenomitos sp.]
MRPRFLGHLTAATAATASLLALQLPAVAADAQATKGMLKAAQMVDLAPNHWAYSAIQSLIEKYRLMGGYPDKTFRGQKPVSRYELAAVLANLMDRLDTMETHGVPATPSDSKLVDRLKDEFKVELRDLHTRLVQLEDNSKVVESALKDLKAKAGGGDKVHGSIGVTVQDDPEDRLKPYVTSSFEVKFASDIDENTSMSASIGGGKPAVASGGTPVFTRGDKKDKGLPDGHMYLNANTRITTKIPSLGDASFRVGYFPGGALVGLGGFAHHYWDGIIGSGLSGPSGNTVRLGGDGDIGIGAKFKSGPLGYGLGINTQFFYGGASMDLGGLGDVRIVADGDHNSIGNVNLEGDPTYHAAAALNLGSDKLGLSLQGGITYSGTKVTPKGAMNFITSPFGGSELCVGMTFKTDTDMTTGEIIPTGYFYYPAQGYIPSVLVGAKEPETIFDSKGQQGPGSLLGSKAGWTVQLGIPNPLMPNLTFELNMQSNLLMGDYDGIGYAISTSTDF